MRNAPDKHPSTILILLALSIAVASQTASAINRGRQILLDRGLQLQAVVHTPDDQDNWTPGFPYFDDANLFLDANFTTVDFWHDDTTAVKANFAAQAGSRPWQWSRKYQAHFSWELTPGEKDYIDNFVALHYEDELPQTPENLDAEKTAFARWKQLYPNALAFTNFNWGTQYVEDYAGLRHFMQYTEPDMLMFDMYPGYYDYAWYPLRNVWYSTMQRYRTVALEGVDGAGDEPLPYAQYLDLWRRASGAMPPESFVRLQQFASWAFGFTLTSAFIYNQPDGAAGVYAAMFDGPGDDNPNVVFDYVTESNRQSLNLGPALVRLVSTDIRMIPGWNELVDGTDIPAWDTNANNGSNYIASITPIQDAGGAPDPHYHDILIGYFKPLLDDNTDYPFADGQHFMIVNGTPFFGAEEKRQWYRVIFDFADSGITPALQRLSRDTGLVEDVPLTHVGGSQYQLDFSLPGGTGDLFRLESGCGDYQHPFPMGDLNKDCRVNLPDFAVMAAHWLECADPACD